MTQLPLVSIGLPVYNGERHLTQALDALLAQDYPNFELIISDNGSTDATEAICRERAARDARIKYFRASENHGAAWNFHRVFELATGKYFMWAAHDDVRGHSYVSRCVELLEANPAASACHSQTQFLDHEGRPAELDSRPMAAPFKSVRRRLRHMMRFKYMTLLTYSLMRLDVLRRIPLNGRFYRADVVFVTELALHGPILQVPETLFHFRLPPPESVDDYIERLADSVMPGRRYTRFAPLRLIQAYHHLRSIGRAPLGRHMKLALLFDFLLGFSLHRDTIDEGIRWTRVALGPNQSQRLKRIAGPLRRLLRRH